MSFRKILSHSHFWSMLIFLVIQQLVVASSNIWIINLIKNIQTQSPFYINLALYLTSLILPFIPGSIASIYLEKWKAKLIVNLSTTFRDTFQNEQKIWIDGGAKDTRLPVLSSEGISVLNNFTEYVYGLASTLINAIFNITVLSLLINASFGIGYFISLCAVALCMKLWKEKQESLTERAQRSRIGFMKILLKSWDNVLLGNRYNFGIWNTKLLKTAKAFSHREVTAKRFGQWCSVIIAFLTFAPCFFTVILTIIKNASNPLVLGAIAVTLPRLFLILNYTYELLYQFFHWPQQKSLIVKIDQILGARPESTDLSDKINWDKLQCSYSGSSESLPIKRIEDVVSQATVPRRITIRGENGAGKTMLLLSLKNHFKDNAFFLPNKHHLYFKGNIDSLSLGQGMKLALEEINEYVNTPIILLDEWDANLDQNNQNILSKLIDTMAEKYCIIEVRHRN